MIVSLPMYDWPALAPSHDTLWSLIRSNLGALTDCAPAKLNRNIEPWDAWTHPDLLLGQSCGLPFRTRLHGKVRLVGTIDYAVPEAPAGYYYSELVVRTDDDRKLEDLVDSVLAINGWDSQSGWAAPQNFVAPSGLRFRNILKTGAHRESARAVAEGRADIAAIDAVTWRLICRFLPEISERLHVLTHTDPTPALPLITARSNDPDLLFDAVASAITQLPADDRAALGICGLKKISEEDYLAVPVPILPSRDIPPN